MPLVIVIFGLTPQVVSSRLVFPRCVLLFVVFASFIIYSPVLCSLKKGRQFDEVCILQQRNWDDCAAGNATNG